MIYYGNELYHYGILGMHWGVRKKSHANSKKKALKEIYSKYKSLRKKEDDEAKKLLNSSKKLQRDFGSDFDDPEYFETVARKYGLNTKPYWDAHRAAQSYYSDNKKAIRKGKKLNRPDHTKANAQTYFTIKNADGSTDRVRVQGTNPDEFKRRNKAFLNKYSSQIKFE